MLSEYAVLGFEYGYSLSEPNALTLWEAQFGDFANGAQIMIDQFVNSGESKWLRMSGLVLLLPHGYEGQGPEHSSARLERFLQLSAEDNWIVANCSTPANYFHVLRRQLHRTYRKPLILMTPKSLLRHPLCISRLPTLPTARPSTGSFGMTRKRASRTRSSKPTTRSSASSCVRARCTTTFWPNATPKGWRTFICCVVEQLYPVPSISLTQELSRFPKADFIWCQEEPKNQGAWSFIEPEIETILTKVRGQNRPAWLTSAANRRPPPRRASPPATSMNSKPSSRRPLAFDAPHTGD